MRRFVLTDEILNAMFWLRGVELRVPRYRKQPTWAMIHRLLVQGVAHEFKPRGRRAIWKMSKAGRDLINGIIQYEEENPRYSAEEGPSTLLHGDTLFSWSHRTAIHEIEDLRRLRQRREERTAKRAGRTGCAKTRCRAEPRPKVDICVDDCRDRALV